MKKLVVSAVPGRTRPALCIEDGNAVSVLAYFRNQEAVDKYMDFLTAAGDAIRIEDR